MARGRAAGPAGTAALGALLIALLLLAASAASRHSGLVPAGRRHFPDWLAGPLQVLGVTSSSARYQTLLLAILACYAIAMACAGALRSRALWIAIVLAHAIALLAPPLLSADVFGYLDFARLGVLHGLDPYTHTAAAAPQDQIYGYLGWHDVRSPYGPLFTLLSYSVVPLGVAGGIWALKALAALTSLAAVVLVWHAAQRLGRSPQRAALLLGLNPLVLVFAVGGAHNDTLLGAFVAGGVLLALSGRERGGAAALTASVGVKAASGLVLPFALLGARERLRFGGVVLGVLAALAALAVAGFGVHALGFLDAVRGQQQFVAVHSVPSEVSRALGLGRLDGTVRTLFALLLVAAIAFALWRVWRGADWLDGYGWATLTLLACTAWLLPWYGLWALVPAALSGDRRLRLATLAFSAYLVATRLPLTDPLLGG